MLKLNSINGPSVYMDGVKAGTPSLFLNFSACNLWDGKKESQKSSVCDFCDSHFNENIRITPDDLFNKIIQSCQGRKYQIVFTGGEPLLQNSNSLIMLLIRLKKTGYITLLETNGSIHHPATSYFNHVVCSPKQKFSDCMIDWKNVNEIRLLYPMKDGNLRPEFFNKESLNHCAKFIQPIFSLDKNITMQNISNSILLVIQKGEPWRLNLEIGKIMGIKK